MFETIIAKTPARRLPFDVHGILNPIQAAAKVAILSNLNYLASAGDEAALQRLI